MLMNQETEERAPLGIYKEGMPWNPVEKVIFERRSVRRFIKKPLPDNMIRRILEAARFAPSAGNCQPWKLIVIKDPEIIQEMERDAVRISKLFMYLFGYTNYTGIGRLVRKLLAKTIAMRLFANEFNVPPFISMAQAVAGETVFFQNAPVIILILEDRRGVSNPAVDVGIVGQNMVLAAHSLGAGACWMGFIKLLTYHPKWRKKFGTNTYPYRLRESICLGWPASKVDREVPREVQLVQWFDNGMNGAPRTERQGE
jgi:nitroreductase